MLCRHSMDTGMCGALYTSITMLYEVPLQTAITRITCEGIRVNI